MTQLQKRYGLSTAIAMVVGIVIGSGVFFKAEKILQVTGGDLKIGILAWIIGGLIIMSCAYNFAMMATKYEKVNGLVDYAEALVGPKYGYFIGWFMATIYGPSLAGVLSWVAARYTVVLLKGDEWSSAGPEALIIALVYLIGSYALNTLSPVLAGKFQVSATIIKLIPLFLMGIFGFIFGLQNGILVENFSTVTYEVTGNPLFAAIVATAFAYDGWIVATSINAELRDAKKNLPRALIFGTILIMVAYILYYVGLAGSVENAVLMESGEQGAKIAFSNVFTEVGGTALFVFIVISCLGTLNGLMLGNTRGFYALGNRNQGINPELTKQVDAKTNVPTNSAVIGLFLAALWLFYFFGAVLADTPWFGNFSFDISELSIISLYALFIPIFFNLFRSKTIGLNFFNGKIMPIVGILGALFMVVAAYVSHGQSVWYYLIVFIIIQIIGMFFYKN